jgi:hypothetical protein
MEYMEIPNPYTPSQNPGRDFVSLEQAAFYTRGNIFLLAHFTRNIEWTRREYKLS